MIAILADAFVKATVLLLVAAAGSWALRHSAAALRHLVWALACGGVLALPLAAALLPNLRVAGWPRFDAPVAFRLHQVSGEPLAPSARQTATPQPATVQPAVRATRHVSTDAR